jgi:hypothetical protein
MKLYIAGKVTGENGYKIKFYNAAMWLRVAGYSVCSPAEHGLENAAWRDAIRCLIPKMLECDGVALLPDWRRSRGAKIEARLAREVGIPVRPVRGWLKGKG